MKRIALLTTGGTMEKTYNESDGTLGNEKPVLDMMLARLVLRGVSIDRVAIMNKDSLQMSEVDHSRIAQLAAVYVDSHDGVIITHGTDRLSYTGEALCKLLSDTPRVPVVLTGAMRPYELRTTDALQNLTEALLAVQICAPGVYVSMHNEVLRFPGVVKDVAAKRFVKP